VTAGIDIGIGRRNTREEKGQKSKKAALRAAF